ncbi:hypothetical protein AB0M46_33080 [Dactylosporangium sp. NPDC051485]|uniref:hypothetical protein n=1 Tax=Dactylosporangium sp. NPDC051485 TaxID=3154846 RepID=UPI003441A128
MPATVQPDDVAPTPTAVISTPPPVGRSCATPSSTATGGVIPSPNAASHAAVVTARSGRDTPIACSPASRSGPSRHRVPSVSAAARPRVFAGAAVGIAGPVPVHDTVGSALNTASATV